MKTRESQLSAGILSVLREAAEQSCEHQTVWIDLDVITLAAAEHFTRGSRRLVKSCLVELRSQGLVESRVFHGHRGWRLLKNGG